MKLKPETIERLKRERQAAAKDRHADLIARLTDKVQQHGHGSIYAELLAEATKTEQPCTP